MSTIKATIQPSSSISAEINPSSKVTAATVGIHNINASSVGLGNVTNESKATMFANPTFTGTVDTTTLNSSLVTVSTTSEGNAENRLLRLKGPKPQLYFEDVDVNTTARAYTRFRRANDLFELSQVSHDYTSSATLTKIDLDNSGATKHHTYVGANRVGLFDQVGLSLGGNDSAGYLLDLRRHGTPSNTGNTLRIAQQSTGTAIRIGAGAGDSVVTLLRVDGSSTNGMLGATDNAASGFSLKYDGTGSGAQNKLVWYADNADSATAQSQVTAQTILNDGKVGIGTLTPTEALEVSGNLKVSQNITGASLTGQLFTSAQPFITGVGTIGTGVWQGTPIANAYVADLPTSKITSGTFADGRISSSSVTQHQGDLVIGASQITGTLANARIPSNITRDSELTGHTNNVSNPHSVTKAQLGLSNVENKSAATIIGEIVDDDIPSSIARDSELTAHTNLTNNPHSVTKTQIGLSNVENKSSATIRGEIVDSDIPSSITRDSQLSTHTSLTNNPHNVTAGQVGLQNVTNESKDTMFNNPTFTGTVSGVTAAHVGLGDVTNESKASMFTSPVFTGTIASIALNTGTVASAPSAAADIANKTYVDTQVAGIVDSAPAALNTLNELAAALGDDANFAATTATSLGEKLVKASNLSDLANASTARTNLGLGNVTNESKATMFTSPTLTGTPIAPTATSGTNTTQIATTQFVQTELALQDSLGELDDVVITSSGDNDVIAYDNATSKYINQTAAEAGLATASDLTSHTGSTSNPHNVTKGQVGLGNVENKSSATIRSEIVDSDIPAAIARDSELSAHTGSTSNPHSVTKAQVGLGNADNTSDANKPISTAQQTAIDAKAPINSPTFTGNVTIPDSLVHDGDTNTKIVFGTDSIDLQAGGASFIKNIADNTSSTIVLNEGGNSVTTRIESDTNENAFVVKSNTGFVGIGTNSPDTLMHLDGGSGDSEITLETHSTGVSGINFGDDSDDDVGGISYNHANNTLIFKANAFTRMVINNFGRVGIGTALPGNELEVNQSGTTNGGIAISGTTTSNNGHLGSLMFKNLDNANNAIGTDYHVAMIGGKATTSDSNAGDDSGGELVFSTKSEAGGMSERMRIQEDGSLLFPSTTANSVSARTLIGGSTANSDNFRITTPNATASVGAGGDIIIKPGERSHSSGNAASSVYIEGTTITSSLTGSPYGHPGGDVYVRGGSAAYGSRGKVYIGDNQTTNSVQFGNSTGTYQSGSKPLVVNCDPSNAFNGCVDVGRMSMSAGSFEEKTSNFTVSTSDRGKTFLLNNSSAITITIGSGMSVGHTNTFIALTNNDVTIVKTSSTTPPLTLNSYNGANTLSGQFAQAQLIFITGTSAVLGGNLV